MRLIINYNRLGDSKLTNDVLLNKLYDVLIIDVSISFRLYPFTEVVGCHKQEFLLSSHDGQGSYYVHPPLREWTETRYQVDNFRCIRGMGACLWHLSHFLT